LRMTRRAARCSGLWSFLVPQVGATFSAASDTVSARVAATD
jgi:hypothetical protein